MFKLIYKAFPFATVNGVTFEKGEAVVSNEVAAKFKNHEGVKLVEIVDEKPAAKKPAAKKPAAKG